MYRLLGHTVLDPTSRRQFGRRTFNDSSRSRVTGLSFTWPTVSFTREKELPQDRIPDRSRRQHLCKEKDHRRSLP